MIARAQAALLICFLTGFASATTVISQADPNLLSTKVKELTEQSLKFKELQNYLDTLPYDRIDLLGFDLLNAMSSAFERKFQSRTEAVKKLATAVRSSYSGTSSPSYKCCLIPSGQLEHDTRFKQPVSTSQVCELISSNAPSSSTRLQSGFSRACMDNLASVPSMKWQYFGSEQGVTTQFPATKATKCGNFDNRFRPWYVQANVPIPKQVVIVIDRSGSMSQEYKGVSYMKLAIEAAKTVIDTLNPYDKFAFIAFSSSAELFTASEIPNGTCYRTSFAQATPKNKKLVKEHIDDIYPSGGTGFVAALQAAFTFFDLVKDDTEADKVMLFMSDGKPSDSTSNIYQTITYRNRNLNNSVIIMTYGLGSGVDSTVLQNMAKSTEIEVGSDNKQGQYTAISTPSNLRNKMASYYNFFSIQGQRITKPVWTVPYLDGWGLGLMITAALPVYTSNLIGVAAVDITIEELLAESSFFKPTELFYSFVINKKGLVINHPLFPTVTTGEPLFVEVTAFESDPQFLSVFSSMKSGGSGNKTFMSTRILPQGDSTNYPVRKVRVQSTYYWKQISGTEFSLCLVLADNDQQVLLQNLGSLPSDSFLYHRLDLVQPKQQCYHGNNFCSKDQSSVALAARAFKDPEQYISVPETVNDVTKMANYMEGKTSSTVLKAGVKNEVVATYKAEELWKKIDEDDLSKNVFWRYVATKEGMMRIFPGTQLPSNFDPTTRSWYEYTLANRDKYVVTPPYRDAASTLSVISLCRALFEGRQGGVHDPIKDKLIGAMGVDIVTPYFIQILSQLYPFCNETSRYSCLVIDHSGFVIASPSFLTAPETAFNRHIAAEDKNLAAALFAANILKPAQCSNIENGLIQKTFTISANQSMYIGRTFYPDCYYFELKPVEGTNALMLMVDKSSKRCSNFVISSCRCTQSYNADTPTCSSSAYTNCSCPCTTYNGAFHPCENQYLIDGSTPPPCTPDQVDLTKVGTPPVDLTTLGKCYNIAFTVPRNSTANAGGQSTNITIIVVCVVVGLILLAIIFMCCRKWKSGASVGRSAPATIHTAPAPAANTNYGYASSPSAPPQPPPTNPYYTADKAPPGQFPPSYSASVGYNNHPM